MDRTSKLAPIVEEIAADAWPAAIVEFLDGWRLRATPEVEVRRSNYVLPNSDGGTQPLEEKLDAVEEFYVVRGLPVRFQISPAAPDGLDDELARRGFEVEAPVDVMVADLDEVIRRSDVGSNEVEVTVAADASEPWLDTLLGITARGERGTFRAAILDRINPPVWFASVLEGDRVLAVGMAVAARGWAGIFSMATLPEARRRGFATGILGALSRSALELGATRAYLQTDRGNAASHALYEGIGFATAYGYHYRTRR
jgi:GNAT superfamily N-acetyltransferase